MNPESAEHAVEREQRRALVKALMDAGLWECQIGKVLMRALHDPPAPTCRPTPADSRCRGEVSGLHELRKRSSQGSVTNLANLMPACSFHNGWVEDNPNLAYRLGLVVREGDPTWWMLGKDRWE